MDFLYIISIFWCLFLLFGISGTIYQVGRPREPLSGGAAVVIVGLNALLIWTLLSWMGVI